jgi:hypothetical protein
MATAGVVKHTNGQMFRSNEEQILLNVFNYTECKNPEKMQV